MAEPRGALQFDDRLSEADALMWNLESDPVLRSTIVSTTLLDREPDLGRFEAKLAEAAEIIPRLQQRIVSDPLGLAPPRWERDPHFDPRFHVRRVRVPAPGGIRELLDLAEPIAMHAFDKDRPLWELYIVEGLKDGRSAVIMKLHHAISDGVGLVKMTECLVERERDAEAVPAPSVTVDANTVSEPSGWDRVRDALVHRLEVGRDQWQKLASAARRDGVAAARRPVSTAREIGRTLASAGRVLAPAATPLSPVMLERSTRVRFDYLPIPLDALKRAGKFVGGTVNDAFVAAVSGGLARYHDALGEPVEELRMLMPVNVREGERADKAGNQFAPARFVVPVGIVNPAERIQAIGALCREQRAEPALPWVETISGVLGALPTAAVGGLVGAMQKTTDFTTSNVPGPRRATFMSGAKVEGFMPFGPLAGAGANFTVFSYDGVMHVGVNMDPAAVTDPALLMECLQKGFDEVLSVTG